MSPVTPFILWTRTVSLPLAAAVVQKILVTRASRLIITGVSPSLTRVIGKLARRSGLLGGASLAATPPVPHERRRTSVWLRPRPELNGVLDIGSAHRRRHHPRCDCCHSAGRAMTKRPYPSS